MRIRLGKLPTSLVCPNISTKLQQNIIYYVLSFYPIVILWDKYLSDKTARFGANFDTYSRYAQLSKVSFYTQNLHPKHLFVLVGDAFVGTATNPH
jgi:hypothetical protein